MRRIALLALFLAVPAQASDIGGRWVTTERDSVVEIAPCSAGTGGAALCGRVVRLLKAVEGGPAIDRNNPDASLRSRPLVGLPILLALVPKGKGYAGRIYDPRNGRTYRSVVAAQPDGKLKVSGCIGPLCRSFAWTRG